MWGYEYEQQKREQRRKTISILVLLTILIGVAAWAWFEFVDLNWTDRKLFAAARNGDAAAVYQALGNGANVHAVDGDGFTPLHVAAWHGHRQAARALISSGANPNARDRETGETPLHTATRANRAEMVVLLMSAGARSRLRTFTQSRPDVRGNVHPPEVTPYQMAEAAGFQEIVRVFGGDRAEDKSGPAADA